MEPVTHYQTIEQDETVEAQMSLLLSTSLEHDFDEYFEQQKQNARYPFTDAYDYLVAIGVSANRSEANTTLRVFCYNHGLDKQLMAERLAKKLHQTNFLLSAC